MIAFDKSKMNAATEKEQFAQFRLAAFTKFHHWKYEKEVRRIVHKDELLKEGGQFFLPFSNDFELVEIVIGANSKITSQALRRISSVTTKDVKIITSRIAFKSFSVVEQQDADRQK